jgi:hypothetical protein
MLPPYRRSQSSLGPFFVDTIRGTDRSLGVSDIPFSRTMFIRDVCWGNVWPLTDVEFLDDRTEHGRDSHLVLGCLKSITTRPRPRISGRHILGPYPAHTTSQLEREPPWPPQPGAQRVGIQNYQASPYTRPRDSFPTRVRCIDHHHLSCSLDKTGNDARASRDTSRPSGVIFAGPHTKC